MIMGTPKFDNTKTWVAVQVTFTHPFPLTCLHNRCKFNPETFWWGSKKRSLITGRRPRRILLKSTMLNRLSIFLNLVWPKSCGASF